MAKRKQSGFISEKLNQDNKNIGEEAGLSATAIFSDLSSGKTKNRSV